MPVVNQKHRSFLWLDSLHIAVTTETKRMPIKILILAVEKKGKGFNVARHQFNQMNNDQFGRMKLRFNEAPLDTFLYNVRGYTKLYIRL